MVAGKGTFDLRRVFLLVSAENILYAMEKRGTNGGNHERIVPQRVQGDSVDRLAAVTEAWLAGKNS